MWHSQHLDCSLSLSPTVFGWKILSLGYALLGSRPYCSFHWIYIIYTILITMVRLISSLLLASLCATAAWADEDPPSCSTSEQCPEDKPCCSREWSKYLESSVQQELMTCRIWTMRHWRFLSGRMWPSRILLPRLLSPRARLPKQDLHMGQPWQRGLEHQVPGEREPVRLGIQRFPQGGRWKPTHDHAEGKRWDTVRQQPLRLVWKDLGQD